ncbi:hypothetical protein DXG01_016906 [Tephrocybe rancida]|nr:hypothetical protein DXG01_016906 [Tephrocybe rancida]
MNMNYIDPSSLTDDESGSPSPSSSGDSGSSSNPRKRARTESSSEERKEARAHRNRIAAQNSRDRRKAQFTFLERRVAELEAENRALRAARGVPLLPVGFHAEERAEASARERENEELKERIRTLEQGWDAVLKALAVQGVPLAAAATTAAPAPVPQPTTPQTTTTTTTTYPSPALSASSPSFSTPTPSPTNLALPLPSIETETASTRHLARVATIAGGRALSFLDLPTPSSSSAPPTVAPPPAPATADPDDAAMETLFMEILAVEPLPAPADAAAPAETRSPSSQVAPPLAPVSAEGVAEEMVDLGLGLGLEGTDMGLGDGEAWDSNLEMQRILAALGAGAYEEQGPSELDMELGWSAYEGVGVF